MLRSLSFRPLARLTLVRYTSTNTIRPTTPSMPPPGTQQPPASSPASSTEMKDKLSSADEALREAMEERSGGGLSAAELEGGKQVGLKRGVKENMFRVI